MNVAFVFASLIVVIAADLRSLEKMKQDAVISQFREKLLETLSEILAEPVLSGASHRGSRLGKFRPLRKVHGISTVVEDADPVISKMIFPGFDVSGGRKQKGQLFEFRVPKTISRSMMKSAKLFIYVDQPGRDIRGWRIDVVNSTKTISKNYKVTSKAKLQQFMVSDMIKSYLGNVEGSLSRPYLTLRLSDHNIGLNRTRIKSIMLMVSVKTAPKRQRRSTNTEDSNWCTNSSMFCCIQRFSVHPSRLYLQNLISPDVINLNYCRGDCNYYIRGKSNYAKALELLKRSKLSAISPNQLRSMNSCCAPQQYSNIRIKVLNDQTQELVEITVSDMIVSSCGCY